MDIKKELSKIMENTKMPLEIRVIIKKIHEEYRAAYRILIDVLKTKYPEKEIINLEIETLQDYKEDLKMAELLEFEEYEQKRVIIIETINEVLKSSNNKRNIEVKNSMENILRTIKKEKCLEFANIVLDNTISEIESSSKYVLNKINYLKLQDSQELQQAKEEFKQRILKIKEEAMKRKPEIEEHLNQHFVKIYIELENVITNYNKERCTEQARRKEDDER